MESREFKISRYISFVEVVNSVLIACEVKAVQICFAAEELKVHCLAVAISSQTCTAPKLAVWCFKAAPKVHDCCCLSCFKMLKPASILFNVWVCKCGSENSEWGSN